jgi:FkbM family methyltransferase
MHRLGFDTLPYDAEHFPELRRPELLQERKIDLVLDVGANEGHWAEGLRRSGYRGRIVSFEPLAAAFPELERCATDDPKWDTCQVALGDRAGTATFHVADNLSSSSLLPMAPRHVASAPESAYVADELVEVHRLDDLASELVRPGERVWLKIDVQGFELPVLQGAEQTLDQVEIVEAELSLVELYEGQALLGEVTAYLTSRGFGARFLQPIFGDPITGELLQVDGIFARRRAS